MPVPSSISDLSATPSLNSPAGTESPSTVDDYLRTQAAFIRQVDDKATGTVKAADLAATGGAALVGFNGRTVDAKLKDIKTPADFASLQAFITASSATGSVFIAPPVDYSVSATLKVPNNSRIHWTPGVVLTAANGLNANILENSDMASGNIGIEWSGHLKIEGNYPNQTGGNGITFDKVTDSAFGTLEANNCKGHGILWSECNRNTAKDVRASSNGKTLAAYGMYLYNSSDNEVSRARVEDNCIGIAVEASGAGKTATRNTLSNVKARNNRADYSQSGAGVHFEESAGGYAGDNVVIYPDCRDSSGVGINLTDVDNIRIIEPVIRGNAKTGLAALQSLNIQIIGGEAVGNASTEGAGYRAQLRFDDSGLTGCTGRVIGLKASGSEVGVKTYSAGCGMQFVACDLDGTTSGYQLAGSNDSVSGPNAAGVSIEPRKPMFRAGRNTNATSGVIVFDSEVIDTRSNYNPSTGVFTVSQAGAYVFGACATDASAARIVIQLQRNSATFAEVSSIGGIATESTAVIPLTPVLCAAGDQISVNLATGTALGGSEKTYFCGFFVG